MELKNKIFLILNKSVLMVIMNLFSFGISAQKSFFYVDDSGDQKDGVKSSLEKKIDAVVSEKDIDAYFIYVSNAANPIIGNSVDEIHDAFIILSSSSPGTLPEIKRINELFNLHDYLKGVNSEKNRLNDKTYNFYFFGSFISEKLIKQLLIVNRLDNEIINYMRQDTTPQKGKVNIYWYVPQKTDKNEYVWVLKL